MADITNKDENNIKQIIQYFNNGQISAFIGAGFSKNANKSFPDWDELLFDMVDELYQEEVNNATDKDLARDRIIRRQGTTRLPEEYIQYKGRREDLTSYIEERIYPFDDKIDISNLGIHKDLLALPWVDICTTNYDSVLEQANFLIGSEWEVVYDSSSLSKCPRKRIVKLHGHLREEKTCYCFDGSEDHQYIITKSDYDNYPQKHYGFTTFMQSKILQESFCMIGFSGNDPNFKSWIYWVRDLLKNNNTVGTQIPIYLLDVTESEKVDRTPATELFLKNHNIERILLSDLYNWFWTKNNPHPEFKKTSKQKKTIENILKEFFEYLKRNISWSNPLLQVNTLPFQKQDYYSFWDSSIDNKSSETLIYSKESTNDNKFPRLPAPYAIVRANHAYLTKIKAYWKKSYDIWFFLDHCIQFSKNYLLLPVHYLTSDQFNEIEKIFMNLIEEKDLEEPCNLKIWLEYSILLLKTYRIILDLEQFSFWKEKIGKVIEKANLERNVLKNFNQEVIYQTCLFYANSLNQEEFDIQLSDWKPEDETDIAGQWILKKVFLLNLFQRKDNEISETIKILLEKAISIEKDAQEKLWILENYGLVLQGRIEEHKKIKAEIAGLKSKGYISLQSITDYLLEDGKKVEIKPADSTRNKGKTISIGGIPAEQQLYYKALQYFYVVEESGLLLSHKSCVWDSVNKTYKFFKEIQNDYLYISLCHFWPYTGNDATEEILRKRSQDVLFSDDITPEKKEDLLIKLIHNFNYRRNNNHRVREIFFIIAELMRTVSYKKWSSFWNEFWINILKDNAEEEWKVVQFWFYRDQVWGWRVPLNQILPIVDDKKAVERVVYAYLIDERLKDVDLSSIKLNPHYRDSLLNILKDPDIRNNFLTPENIRIIDIFPWIEKKDKEFLSSQIDKNKVEEYQIDFLLLILPFFSIDDSIVEYCHNLCLNYIDSLPENSFPGRFPIYNFLSTMIKLKDYREIYSIEIIKKYMSKWGMIEEYLIKNENIEGGLSSDGILRSNILPYFDYFKINKEYYSEIDGFIDFYEKIEIVANRMRNIDERVEIIISGDVFSFESIAFQIINDQINYSTLDLKKYISLIINRIIFIDHIKNENILFFFVKLFYANRGNSDFLEYFKDQIILLLKKYKNISEEHDRILIEDHLIRIFEIYELYIENKTLVEYWKLLRENSHYFEVRNLTKLYIIPE